MLLKINESGNIGIDFCCQDMFNAVVNKQICIPNIDSQREVKEYGLCNPWLPSNNNTPVAVNITNCPFCGMEIAFPKKEGK